MVDRVTSSYAKMIAAESGQNGGSFQAFGRNVQEFMQNPLNASKDAAEGLLAEMGSFGTVLGVGAAGLTAVAVAGWNAVKSLGDYGVQVHDAEIRTGLTAKEVGQFGFAARAAGQDITVFERMMRGLTQAVEDNSAAGEKARAWLVKFGVSLDDVKNGTASTSQVLQQIAGGLGALHSSPDPFAEKKAALDLFKRAGIETLPVMESLAENLRIARENGYGPTEEEISRDTRYKQEVTQIETEWDKTLRTLKGIIGLPTLKVIELDLKAVGVLKDIVQNFGWGPLLVKEGFKLMASVPAPPTAPAAPGPAAEMKAIAATDGQAQLKAYLGNQPGIEGAQDKLREMKKALDDARKAATDLAAGPVDPSKADSAMKAIAAATSAYERQSEVVKELKKAVDQSQYVVTQDAINKANPSIRSSAPSLYPQGPGMENANALGWSPEVTVSEAAIDAANAPMDAAKKAQMDARWKGQEDQAKQLQQIRLNGITAETNAAVRLVELRGKDGATAKTVAALRQSALKQELAITGDVVKYREGSLNNELEMRLKIAEQEKRQADEAAQRQQQQMESLKSTSSGLFHTLFTKPGDFGKQLTGTLKESIIRPVTEGLGGLTASAIRPLIYGSDGQGGVAGIFKGVFSGAGKKDPNQVTDENTTATRQNSSALAALTAVFAGAMGVTAPAIAAPAGGIGNISLPAIAAPFRGAVPSLPSIFGGSGCAGDRSAGGGAAVMSAPDFSGIGWGGGFGVSSGGGIAPGGAGTPDIYNLPTSAHSGGNPLAAILGSSGGGSGSAGGGIAGMLKNFKSIKWGGLTRSGPTYGTDANGNDVQTGDGKITGVNGAAGAALFSGGTALAEHGLLGPDRGTNKGIAEGAGGGAAIGFQQGGPLGAAIGAAAGALIGLGEKLAGVESPENEAKRLVKQLYSINIDNAMAKQIAGLAQQKYAGQVSVAVRDPDVRKMLMLYSEATGQKMPLSASTPYGGSLAEQNGKLYQQATYQDGTPYTFKSALPVLGNLGGNNYPSPGPNAAGASGPTYLSLHIDGSATADFMTGQYVTPGFVQSQFAAAGNASDGRLQNAAMLNAPGLLIS